MVASTGRRSPTTRPRSLSGRWPLLARHRTRSTRVPARGTSTTTARSTGELAQRGVRGQRGAQEPGWRQHLDAAGNPRSSRRGVLRDRRPSADPDTAFAATTRGLFRTTNGGTDWSQLTNGLPAISSSVFAATDVAIDPSDPIDRLRGVLGPGRVRTTNGRRPTRAFRRSLGSRPAAVASRSPSPPPIRHALRGGRGCRGQLLRPCTAPRLGAAARRPGRPSRSAAPRCSRMAPTP